MKNCVIYARFSDEKQNEQSIEGQISVCTDFARRNDLNIVGTYIDRATTGKNDQRPAFQQMLRDAQKKTAWDIVLIYAIDRFGRNAVEISLNKYKLKQYGKTYISATQRTSDNIDGTKNLDGILLENVYIGIAEYYSEELSQKVRRGLNESYKKGQFTGGQVPYGYDIVDKKYVINETEASVIREIFERYIKGDTALSIVEDLEKMHIRNKAGNPFQRKHIYQLIRNETYIGIVRKKGVIYTNMAPAIIDSDTWNQVQQIIDKNKQNISRKKNQDKYFMSGKLYCGECGAKVTGEAGTSHTGNVYTYYKCANKHTKKNNCSLPQFRTEFIDAIVFGACIEVLRNGAIPFIVQQAIKVQEEDSGINYTIQVLQDEIKNKQRAIDNLLKAIEEGLYTQSTKDRLISLENELASLKTKLETALYEKNSTLTEQDYYRFLDAVFHSKADDEAFKRLVLEALIYKVYLFEDRIKIIFNYTHNGSGKTYKEEMEADIGDFKETVDEYSQSSSLDLQGAP